MASPIRILGTALRWLAPVAVIAICAIAARALILAREEPPKIDRPPRALPVEVVSVVQRDHDATVAAYGTVRPLRTLTVRPTVGGPIVTVHPGLLEGGRIDAGETLVAIDTRDYELSVATAEADLVAAHAQLDIELGSAAVAAREWELLGDSVEVTEDGQRLALREPYVAQRRAEVSGAEAQLNRAKLDLERTVVAAPFDAVVLSEDVELGTQAVVGAELARLVDRTEFVVEVSVPMARLPLIRLDGAPATVVLETGVHEGRVERLLGEVDAAGRMARVQVAIPDPLGDDGAPVLLGAYVRVDLPSRPIPGAVSVPRAALREGDVVWTLDDEDRLEIVPVDVALRRPEDVLVSGGLDGGERIVVSPISVPLPGMLLAPRSRDDEGGAAQPASFDVPASFEDPAAFKVKGSGE